MRQELSGRLYRLKDIERCVLSKCFVGTYLSSIPIIYTASSNDEWAYLIIFEEKEIRKSSAFFPISSGRPILVEGIEFVKEFSIPREKVLDLYLEKVRWDKLEYGRISTSSLGMSDIFNDFLSSLSTYNVIYFEKAISDFLLKEEIKNLDWL